MKHLRGSFTMWALIALGLGFGLGILAEALGSAPLLVTARWLEPIGTLWTNALRMTVIPLVLSNLVLGVAGSESRSAGRLGALSLASFLVMLIGGALLTVLLLTPVLGMLPAGAASLGGAAAGAGAAGAGAQAARLSFADWLIGLVPVNPFKAAVDGDILPLLVFTVPFALALTQVREALRRPFLEMVRVIAETMFVLLRWILRATPLAVFCLSFAIAARTGPGSAGAVVLFIVLVSALLVVCTLLLYPLAAVLGRVSMAALAHALAPAQIVAASTRSSLASLPALLEGAERRLGLPTSVTGLVLPLSVATFKVNRTVSSTAKLLFLTHVYGIPLAPVQIGAFVASVLLISFSTPGVPSAGTLATLPVYLAFGIPIEGLVILSAVDAIPDIFKTVLNVTGDMAAVTMVARFSGTPAAVPARVTSFAAEADV